MKTPTTTHFAVLGLLASRPWSTYELVQYMKTSFLGQFWSKTAARLYETPKELVRLGYATASRERISQNPAAKGRERAVYTITDEGRAALRAWLEEPSQPPSFEIEALVKLSFGEQGTLEGFLAQVDSLLRTIAEPGPGRVLEATAEQPQLPERVHLSAHMADLVGRVVTAFSEWLIELEDEASSWDTIASNPVHQERGKALYRKLAEDYEKEKRQLNDYLTKRVLPAAEDDT